MKRQHLLPPRRAVGAIASGCSRGVLEQVIPPLDNPSPHLLRGQRGRSLRQVVPREIHDLERAVVRGHPCPGEYAGRRLSLPTPVAGEVHSYASPRDAPATTAPTLASRARRGGQCIATIRRYIAGEFLNSQFCRGGGTCSDAGLTTGIDTAEDNAGDVPTTGPLGVHRSAQSVDGKRCWASRITCTVGVWASGHGERRCTTRIQAHSAPWTRAPSIRARTREPVDSGSTCGPQAPDHYGGHSELQLCGGRVGRAQVSCIGVLRVHGAQG